MYHNDTGAAGHLRLRPRRRRASAPNRRVFLQFGAGDGYPDGMTVDAEGCLWIAFWDGWCVRRFSPAGRTGSQTIDMPVAQPTSCAFGGPDLDRLYITSAQHRPR